MSGEASRSGADGDALTQGRREGLAIGALALACVAFINLLGLEKALLAAALAVAALRGASTANAPKRARWALAIAALYCVTWVLIIALLHTELAELGRLLARLG